MDLSQLPRENGFRMRGTQVTRLETFVIPIHGYRMARAKQRLMAKSD